MVKIQLEGSGGLAGMKRRVARFLWILLLAIPSAATHAAPSLPGHDADISALTVSGISSGGYMAVQFHVAHSAWVQGVGVLAAGPYYCASGNSWTAYYNCMTPRAFTPLPPVSKLLAATETLAKAGRIDSTKNLAASKVWLFSGNRDKTVFPEVVSALASYYKHYVNAAHLEFVQDRPAGHAMVSADPDVAQACELTASPFINRCIDPDTTAPYDAAGALFAHLMGASPPVSAQETGSIVEFDQREFASGKPYSISLADVGYVYAPAACHKRPCRVHVAFHGCGQSAGKIGIAFVRDAGYNRWADSHHLIVLYPQTIARYGWSFDGSFAFNPYGCWDWWGYTSANYHTKAAPQIQAVKAMVERLGQSR